MVDEVDKVTPRQARVDLTIIGSCCLLYLFSAFFDLPIIPVITVVVAALAGFVALLGFRGQETWRDFGFRRDNLVRLAIWVVPITLLVAVGMLWFALASGHALWRSGLWVLLPIYPLWGILQQFIFQGIVLRRLRLLTGNASRSIAVTSVVFAAVHLPDFPVVGLTLVAGVCWAFAFYRVPNLWVLGVSHGLLAALAYFWLLNRNPVNDFW